MLRGDVVQRQWLTSWRPSGILRPPCWRPYGCGSSTRTIHNKVDVVVRGKRATLATDSPEGQLSPC